jgi:Carboxypeptidase regulatory-like domain
MKQDMRIASPCTADWNGMVGDDLVRYCPQCQRDVYNFSELTAVEAERIVMEREGRLCARFYQRADGTTLTKDCPASVRVVVQRVSRLASAALAAVMSASPAMSAPRSFEHGVTLLQIQPAKAAAILEVQDVAGARVADAGVTLVDEKSGKKFEARTDANGQVRLTDFPRGSYEITIMAGGFRTLTQGHAALPAREPLKFQLQVGVIMGQVVIVESHGAVMNALVGSPGHPNVFHRIFSGFRRIF